VKIDPNMIPENVKNIAWQASPSNKITNQQEKGIAVMRLEQIAAYCTKALETLNNG